MYEFDYTVEQKSEGKWRILKYLMLFLYMTFVAVYFLIIYITRIIPLGALIPLFLWMLIFFTWRYVKPEYKYVISDAMLTFFILHRGKAKHHVFRTRICDAKAIIPLTEEYAATIRDFDPKVIYSALPSAVCDNAYAILFVNEDGKRSIFKFKATEQALKSLRFYNKETVVK